MMAKEFMIAYPEENMRKYELINGIVYKYPSPYTIHQELIGFLTPKLYELSKKDKTKYFMFLPFDVYLFDDGKEDECNTVVQPDLFICDKAKIKKDGCYGTPDFIIEIIGEATGFIDTYTKLNKYWLSGVKEYWTIEPEEGNILVLKFNRENKKAEGEFFTFNDKVKSYVLEGLEIDFSQFEYEFEEKVIYNKL